MSADITGWCKRAKHDTCDGVLYTATGYHWWCICDCHEAIHQPDPVEEPERHRAWKTWRKARDEIYE